MKAADIVFLLGPSGAGKSTLGSWLAEDLGMLHVEMDRPNVDSVALEGLSAEWDAFLDAGRADDLARAIRDRAASAGRQGAVLSFSSLLVLRLADIRAAERVGVRCLVLWATRIECLAAFLEREQATGRGFTRAYWAWHNEAEYLEYDRAELAPYRLPSFRGGARRPRADLVAEVRTRRGPRSEDGDS